jgi:hypothetical protein
MAPSTVGPGAWGGDHVSMTIAASSIHLEFDCAHGDIPGAFSLNGAGQYSLDGTYVREHGGPVGIGDVPDTHPATYAGTVSGNGMTLTVRLNDTQDVLSTLTLTRGAAGRVVKCL